MNLKEIISILDLSKLPKCPRSGTAYLPIIKENVVDPGCHCHHSNTVVQNLVWQCPLCLDIIDGITTAKDKWP